jgi:hypothetical protein
MSSREDDLEPARSTRLPRADTTDEELTRALAGHLPPVVPPGRPLPADMPPLPVMVLDSVADAAETIYTMRNRDELPPDGLTLLTGDPELLALRHPPCPLEALRAA